MSFSESVNCGKKSTLSIRVGDLQKILDPAIAVEDSSVDAVGLQIIVAVERFTPGV